MLRYQEVFVPGGFPRHTYNPRIELQLEQKLAESKDNLCKLVTVTGQTKSGKTVLARQIFPPEESVWIDGGSVSTEDDFWQIIIEQLELFQAQEKETSKDIGNKVSGKGTAEANFLLAKGSGEVGAEMEVSRGSSTTSSQTLSSRVVALRGLRDTPTPLVIDDFHYIPRDMQGGIVRALKPLVFEGLPVVIIAIPHRRYDALKVEKEMTGRISPISIPIWTEEELSFIPKKGFDLLNYDVPNEFCANLASESIGSPHLMQDFCREISKLLKFEQASQKIKLSTTSGQLESIFQDVAETIGRPIFEKLARGPRQRTDRVPRELKSGRVVDIYELVLHGLAHIHPGLVSLEYEDLRSAIRDVSAAQIPQLQEVARVLKHMATIAATDQSSTPVIDFEEEEKKLHITDPFFAFYLRWGELAKPDSSPPPNNLGAAD
ncbi:ATP-binding protein [Leptolyngbya sp. FACHB-261]|uniref:ATP-binding protein n=1 Tax=Leptolyngbya sp. FACHB-261 TaxID=2692806 RepID=UPI00168506D9|nr:ATP-binding protein [Leptolyngbya sp. FACHB-261]MBD2102550.1 ATP-binding protein [Leptolyngbya sp. FACHB-261]